MSLHIGQIFNWTRASSYARTVVWANIRRSTDIVTFLDLSLDVRSIRLIPLPKVES
jgi:hypothetical protein